MVVRTASRFSTLSGLVSCISPARNISSTRVYTLWKLNSRCSSVTFVKNLFRT